jgi:hypothetical protein
MPYDKETNERAVKAYTNPAVMEYRPGIRGRVPPPRPGVKRWFYWRYREIWYAFHEIMDKLLRRRR